MAHTKSDDHTLLSAWRAGDRRAGASLLTRHHARIYRFFRHKVEPGCVDDLVQATFLGLLESIEGFRAESSFMTLLYAIATRKLARHYRDMARDRRHQCTPPTTSHASLQTPISQQLARCDENARLLEALAELPLDTRIMLELHYWEDRKIKDIALIMGTSVAAVKLRMHRGRRRLFELLDE